jgi:cytolysin-activating lysine-acyltransferase
MKHHRNKASKSPRGPASGPSTSRTAGATAEGMGPPGDAPTVSHMLGEMTWLLTQSPLHRALAIGDLEWLVMPALIHEQFYTFRDGDRPVGLALWAKCGPEAAAKLDRGMIEPENRLTLEEWNNGDKIWLVDLIAPFATPENRHREVMIADLISGPLAGKSFNFHQTDPATGKRTVQTVAADAGEKLKSVIEAALAAQTRQ